MKTARCSNEFPPNRRGRFIEDVWLYIGEIKMALLSLNV